MAYRSIEDTFRSISPRRQGIPKTVISDGFASDSGDLTTTMSQVGAEIEQLRAVYQQQSDLITANTQGVQSNSSDSSNGGSVASTAGHLASSLFSGALGFLSPIATGLLSLFGGGGGSSSTPAPLPVYTAPPPITLDGLLRAPSGAASQAPGTTAAPAQQSNNTTVTVQVNAMDSQSFMDRSTDIANAVRQAMLNNHPINGVVTDL